MKHPSGCSPSSLHCLSSSALSLASMLSATSCPEATNILTKRRLAPASCTLGNCRLAAIPESAGRASRESLSLFMRRISTVSPVQRAGWGSTMTDLRSCLAICWSQMGHFLELSSDKAR